MKQWRNISTARIGESSALQCSCRKLERCPANLLPVLILQPVVWVAACFPVQRCLLGLNLGHRCGRLLAAHSKRGESLAQGGRQPSTKALKARRQRTLGASSLACAYEARALMAAERKVARGGSCWHREAPRLWHQAMHTDLQQRDRERERERRDCEPAAPSLFRGREPGRNWSPAGAGPADHSLRSPGMQVAPAGGASISPEIHAPGVHAPSRP